MREGGYDESTNVASIDGASLLVLSKPIPIQKHPPTGRIPGSLYPWSHKIEAANHYSGAVLPHMVYDE